jgi:hypothetical protein
LGKEMKFNLKLNRRDVSDSELIADIQLCAKKIGKNTITMAEYEREGRFHPTTLTRRFRSWFNVLEKAELEASRSKFDITDDELFDNLRTIWISVARQPRYTEIQRPISKYSAGTYENRFGSWNKALEAFVEWVDQGKSDPYEEPSHPKTGNKNPKRKTKRDISERLRFSILLRDGFRCLACGKSPLKTHGVELHVDHIIPWSEGGETVPENLAAKCKECNLGKGNAFKE